MIDVTDDHGGSRPVVIVGLPRSGTTWTAGALTQDPAVMNVLEPDNEDHLPSAIWAKHRLGRYPTLQPGDRAPDYRRFWEWVFSGTPDARRYRFAKRLLGPGQPTRIHDGHWSLVTRVGATIARRPTPGPPPWPPAPFERLVAKSIHLQLAIEWLADEFPVDVLILFRHPANVLASWIGVNLKDGRNSTLETSDVVRQRYTGPWGVPPPGDDPLERMCWRIGLLMAVLEDVAARHPGWSVRVHEDLCVDSATRFRELAGELGLPWGEANEAYLVDHDEPGEGFRTRRKARDVPDSWKQRLDREQLAVLRRTLARFPVTRWTDEDFEPTASPGPASG